MQLTIFFSLLFPSEILTQLVMYNGVGYFKLKGFQPDSVMTTFFG